MPDSEDGVARIVGAILNQQRPEIPENLYIDDLILHANEFRVEYNVVSRIGGRFPCIRRKDNSTAPMALRYFPMSMSRYFLEDDPRWLYLYGYFPEPYFSIDAEDNTLVFVEPDEAKGYLHSGMVQFLSSRMRSLSATFDIPVLRVNLQLPIVNFFGFVGATVSTSGFRVDVSASPNLRVHVSPTFRRSWRFFASPTSPASGTLPGGIYEFAVDGGPYAGITPDSGTFDIPYTTVTPQLAL